MATFGAATDPGGTSLAKTASVQELAAPSVFSGLFTPLTFISTVVSSVVSLLLGAVSAPYGADRGATVVGTARVGAASVQRVRIQPAPGRHL